MKLSRSIFLLMVVISILAPSISNARGFCSKIHDETLGWAQDSVPLNQNKLYPRNTDFYFHNASDKPTTFTYTKINNDASKVKKTKTLAPRKWARARGKGIKLHDVDILPFNHAECLAFNQERQKTFGDHVIEKGGIVGLVGGAAMAACIYFTGGVCGAVLVVLAL